MSESYIYPSSEETSLEIRPPRSSEVALCLALEQKLEPNRAGATDQGFFLPGASQQLYDSFFESSYFRLAAQNEELLGFLVALPPGNEHLRRLQTNTTAFDISPEGLLNQESLVWIAKIAVEPHAARRGIGTRLYQQLFSDLRKHPFITTTARSPIMNLASYGFHTKAGFREIGTFYSGDRGELKDCSNYVMYRDAEVD